ncbi:purine-cytosine permease family protein [Pseudonocardia sp. H11422]|uniref:purine-cytosine permease family protein n=1 Tax=Pseudonocardia sp. H11422 TaxID=2835866 RepID=UPI001BDC3441|nr:cytosine permease [Pseudonocardia sp. H11422]
MSQDLDRVIRGPLEVSYTDDEHVVRHAATEDYTTHIMPVTWRSGRFSLTMAWWAMMSGVVYLVTAAVVALAVGTVNALIGMTLAAIAFSAANFLFSRHAARTGLTVALLSRRLFGHGGAALASLLFAGTAIYYAVFEGSVVAVALHRYFGGVLEIWYLAVIVYSIPLVVGGVRRWLDKLNGVLLPFYMAGLVAAVVLAASSDTASSDWLTRGPEAAPELAGPGWLFAFVTYLGMAILMMFTIDFARFGRKQDETFHGIVTFGPVFYLLAFLVNGLAGIFLVDSLATDGPLSESSVVTGIVDLMGIFGVLFILATQTRINTANFYLASTNLEAFFSRVFRVRMPRVAWLLVAGVLAYLLMLTNVLSYLLAALAWQAVFIIAWVGVALTHVALNRGGDKNGLPEFRPGRVKAITPGLAAWFLAAGCGIFLLTLGGRFGATWSSLITLVLSVVLYLTASKLPGRWLLDRPGDPRDEVADIWEARVKCHRCEHSYTAVEMDRDPSTPDHAAICAACGITSTDFLRAARADAGRTAWVERPAATTAATEPHPVKQ